MREDNDGPADSDSLLVNLPFPYRRSPLGIEGEYMEGSLDSSQLYGPNNHAYSTIDLGYFQAKPCLLMHAPSRILGRVRLETL